MTPFSHGWVEKCWGWTRRVPWDETAVCAPLEIGGVHRQHWPHVSLHKLITVAGGYCSAHWHQKRNLFFVERGELLVPVYRHGALPRIEFEELHHLRAGDTLTIESLQVHQFIVLQSGVVWELYWPGDHQAEPLESDIIRMWPGGFARGERRPVLQRTGGGRGDVRGNLPVRETTVGHEGPQGDDQAGGS